MFTPGPVEINVGIFMNSPLSYNYNGSLHLNVLYLLDLHRPSAFHCVRAGSMNVSGQLYFMTEGQSSQLVDFF